MWIYKENKLLGPVWINTNQLCGYFWKFDQLLLLFCRANGEMKHDASDEESEEENEEGDYTVYECPGLAPVSLDNTLQFNVLKIVIFCTPNLLWRSRSYMGNCLQC